MTIKEFIFNFVTVSITFGLFRPAWSVLGTSHRRRTLALNQLCNVDSENDENVILTSAINIGRGPWPDVGEEDGKENEAVCRTNQHNTQVHPATLSVIDFVVRCKMYIFENVLNWPEVENGEDLTLGKGEHHNASKLCQRDPAAKNHIIYESLTTLSPKLPFELSVTWLWQPRTQIM